MVYHPLPSWFIHPESSFSQYLCPEGMPNQQLLLTWISMTCPLEFQIALHLLEHMYLFYSEAQDAKSLTNWCNNKRLSTNPMPSNICWQLTVYQALHCALHTVSYLITDHRSVCLSFLPKTLYARNNSQRGPKSYLLIVSQSLLPPFRILNEALCLLSLPCPQITDA